MDVWDTQVQMFFAADATILQVYNRAMDNGLWSFDICDRVFDGHGERLGEQARVVDLPAQPSQRRELTIRTSDISVYRKCLNKFPSLHVADGKQRPGEIAIWVELAFLDAWQALDQLNAQTHRLLQATSQLTERLGVLQAAFPADVMERLKRLERHGGIVSSGTDAGFEC